MQWIRKQRQLLEARGREKARGRQDWDGMGNYPAEQAPGHQDFDGMGNYPTVSDYMGPDDDQGV